MRFGEVLAYAPLLALVGAGLGLIAGSFVATLIMRWPRGQSALAGRSRCDSCAETLGARDLVPVMSFLVARGRCRRCGAAIDGRHLAIELAAAVMGVAAALAHPLPLALVTALLGWWLLLVAALDVEHQWLPDRLTLPLIPLGLAAAWAGLGPPLPDRLIGAAAGWAVLAAIGALYRAARGRVGLGGGDPKLLGAIGAWLGWAMLPLVLAGAGLAGLVALLAMRARGERVDAATRLPLGALMALVAWPLWIAIASGPAFSL